MGGVVHDAKFHPHHLGHTFPGAHLAREPIGLGTTVQEVGEVGELLGSQSSGRARWGAKPQRLGPPSRARFIHWLTAAALTPSASAIWRCGQPCGLRCQAWSRRAAFQFWGIVFIHRSVPDTCP
jgi:hypothetical protein